MSTAPARPKEATISKKTDHPSGDNRFKTVDRTLKRFQYQQDALIEVLHTAQESFGYLSNDLMVYVARQLKLPLSWVYGVATFYHFFSLKPQGDHNCTVCLGTACYVKNAADLITAVRRRYTVEPGQMTPDHLLSLSSARCLGSCGLAPVVLLDGEVIGRAQPASLLEHVEAALAAASPNGNSGKSDVAEEPTTMPPQLESITA